MLELSLRGRVGEGPAEDVGVPEVQRTHLLDGRCGWQGRPVDHGVMQGLPVRVDRGADTAVAGVVPHGDAVVAGRGRVDVISEELTGQVVLGAAPRVALDATVDLRERSDDATADVGMQDHADETPAGRSCCFGTAS